MQHSSSQAELRARNERVRREIVYVSDPVRERAAGVDRRLSGIAGFEIRQDDRPPAAKVARADRWCVVGLSDPPSAADFDRLQACAQSCSAVAAYADNASTLGLGRWCEVLLAGAPVLLNSSSATFEDDLVRAVEEAVAQHSQQLCEEQSTLELMHAVGMVGGSSALLEVFRLAERISHFSHLPVLITGETGTGKELLAQAIYRQDERRHNGPFVPLNCAALSRELSDSELFGHRKGAFTGAGYSRAGLFRSAHGGVLFLDEIGELDLGLQAKLLRVLQESCVLSLGDDRETQIDVRVLAATHRDLARMVAEGTFREDLFHRLNVVLLHIPPLRERPDDIPALLDHFLSKHRHLSGDCLAGVEPSFIEGLQLARLSGNARQMENLVRRALLHSGGLRPLTVKDLPADLWQEISLHCIADTDRPASPRSERATAPGAGDFIDALLSRHHSELEPCVSECEQLLVQAVLSRCGGNQTQAARMLGITPRCMYNKLRKAPVSVTSRKAASA